MGDEVSGAGSFQSFNIFRVHSPVDFDFGFGKMSFEKFNFSEGVRLSFLTALARVDSEDGEKRNLRIEKELGGGGFGVNSESELELQGSRG